MVRGRATVPQPSADLTVRREEGFKRLFGEYVLRLQDAPEDRARLLPLIDRLLDHYLASGTK